MTVDMNYKDALNGIVADVLKMDNVLEKDQQKALEDIGKVIKRETQKVLPVSDEGGSGYKHMRDDIKVTVNGKKRKTGVTGVTVHGIRTAPCIPGQGTSQLRLWRMLHLR